MLWFYRGYVPDYFRTSFLESQQVARQPHVPSQENSLAHNLPVKTTTCCLCILLYGFTFSVQTWES